MRFFMRTLASKLDDSVYECENGAEALLVYQEHHPEWTLMDWEMPVMDGLKAAHNLLKLNPAVENCHRNQLC